MDASLVPVVSSLGGVVVGAALQYFNSARTRRWQIEDRHDQRNETYASDHRQQKRRVCAEYLRASEKARMRGLDLNKASRSSEIDNPIEATNNALTEFMLSKSETDLLNLSESLRESIVLVRNSLYLLFLCDENVENDRNELVIKAMAQFGRLAREDLQRVADPDAPGATSTLPTLRPLVRARRREAARNDERRPGSSAVE